VYIFFFLGGRKKKRISLEADCTYALMIITELQPIHPYIYFLCSASPISNSTQQITAIKNISPSILGISESENGKRHHSLARKYLFPL
jgi:transcriptional regulator of acetoin/glycerol metabolism